MQIVLGVSALVMSVLTNPKAYRDEFTWTSNVYFKVAIFGLAVLTKYFWKPTIFMRLIFALCIIQGSRATQSLNVINLGCFYIILALLQHIELFQPIFEPLIKWAEKTKEDQSVEEDAN